MRDHLKALSLLLLFPLVVVLLGHFYLLVSQRYHYQVDCLPCLLDEPLDINLYPAFGLENSLIEVCR